MYSRFSRMHALNTSQSVSSCVTGTTLSAAECAVRVVMIEEVEECATAFLRAPADSPQRLPVRLVPPAGGPQWPGTLRVFSTRAAFEKHCDMYARDITGARVLVRPGPVSILVATSQLRTYVIIGVITQWWRSSRSGCRR